MWIQYVIVHQLDKINLIVPRCMVQLWKLQQRVFRSRPTREDDAGVSQSLSNFKYYPKLIDFIPLHNNTELQRKEDSQCTFNVTLRCVCTTTVAVEKQLSSTNSECVFAVLGIQHVTRMHHIICGLAGSTIILHIISSKAQFSKNKKKGNWTHKCVFWFSLQILSETFLILRRNERDRSIKYTPHVECPLFLPYFNEIWIF